MVSGWRYFLQWSAGENGGVMREDIAEKLNRELDEPIRSERQVVGPVKVKFRDCKRVDR